MAKIVLGLDIGGANLKAATSAGRAKSVPFTVWKHPEKLSTELTKLIAEFPEASEIAATMTAELCDCYETKREGVRRIVQDLQKATKLPICIWSTDGEFVSPAVAKKNHMKVAAANWHALATFARRYVSGNGLLIDVGTTTTDIIPIRQGKVVSIGKTDSERMKNYELLYTGWRRTPATSVLTMRMYATEFFATVLDAHIVLGDVKPDPHDCDTADGRPATMKYAMARLARMTCGDLETTSKKEILCAAEIIQDIQWFGMLSCIHHVLTRKKPSISKECTLILSGSGIFLAKYALEYGRTSKHHRLPELGMIIQMKDEIGEPLASVAPAYAVAVLASERA